jgi:esterase/lipase superfamily enzyme
MVTHYIITNRGITSRKGDGYLAVNANEYIRTDGDEEARDNLRYGTVTFDPKKAKRLKDYNLKILPEPSDTVLENFKETGTTPQGRELPSRKIFGELYEKGVAVDQKNKKLAKGQEERKAHTLLFIHGFNSELEGTLNTLRELHNKFVEPPESPIQNIVLFTWPAKAQLLKYRDDARDAVKSGYALARSFASLKEYFRKTFVTQRQQQCHQKIHLMCHSMGNRVLESMFLSLNEMNIEINSVFGETLLMASDIDYDALEKPRPLYRLLDICERVHVYYHNKDQALGISELTKNAFNRLGKWGTKNSLGLPDDIYQSDVSDIQDDRGLINKVVHHWYYYNSQSVVKDVIEVLNGNTSTFTL